MYVTDSNDLKLHRIEEAVRFGKYVTCKKLFKGGVLHLAPYKQLCSSCREWGMGMSLGFTHPVVLRLPSTSPFPLPPSRLSFPSASTFPHPHPSHNFRGSAILPVSTLFILLPLVAISVCFFFPGPASHPLSMIF